MAKVKKAITVEAPVDAVYRAWRNFENFPRFMDNIEEVRVISDRASHWKAKGPLGTAPEWDAEITLDEPGQAIGWRSIDGSSTKTAGRVSFVDRSASTEIEVTLEYEAPAGVLGEAVAKVFANPERQVDEDLHRFKEIMEHGVEMSALHLFDGTHDGAAGASAQLDAGHDAEAAAAAKRILDRNDQLVRGEVEASSAGEADVGVGHMVNSDRSHVGGDAGNG